MPYTVLHLRWSDVPQDACEKARAALARSAPVPGACLSRDLRRSGTALLDTEVWADGESARRFVSRLHQLVAPDGLGHPSHVASYTLPDPFFAAYAGRSGTPGFPGHPPTVDDGVPREQPPTAIPAIPEQRRSSPEPIPAR